MSRTVFKTVPRVGRFSKPSHIWQNEDCALVATSTGKNEPNLTHWIERLRDVEPAKRLHAATVLGSLGAKAKNAVPALMDALTDDYPEVRRMAAAAIGEIGAEARMAIPTLIQSLKDRDD